MPAFVDTTVKDIDQRLRELQDEVSRLEAARSALTDGRRRPGRPRTRDRPHHRRERPHYPCAHRPSHQRRPANALTRRGGNTRAVQALELVREKPGITIPEIAKAMKIEPNYLYRVLPRLASEGRSSATAKAGIQHGHRHQSRPMPRAT